MSPGPDAPDWTVDPAHRLFISYIDRSREYYAAHGYDTPYRWATNCDAPFTPLVTPLAESRVGVVTTASPALAADRQPVRKEAFAHPASPPPDRMFTADLSWDKDATHTDDVETFLPLRTLVELAAEGAVGSVSPRFYGVPTAYSHRRSERDAAKIEEWVREDDVDLILLIPL